jgi:uncharacterized protein
MSFPSVALIDTGPLVAYYNRRDKYHQQVMGFLKIYTGQLITTDPCITEVMYQLRDYRAQITLAQHIRQGIWQRHNLEQADFDRISELLNKYKDLPADFADLSLVVVSERLNIPAIVSLDKDFYAYRRYRKDPFERIFIPE